jgi:hypothetical protein
MFGHATGLSLLASLLVVSSVKADSNCRCFPGDSCWPSQDVWAKFNETIDGRLVATVPLGTPCHDPTYNEAECKKLREQWTLPELQ